MVRLSGGIYRGTAFAAVCAMATMLACATTPESELAETSAADGEAVAVATQELGRVDVESVDGETTIVLEGLEDPAYTAERILEGNGLVLELSGVGQPSASLFDALSGGDTQVSVYDGLVDVVSASTYEGDSGPITRIEISFAVPAEYEVVSTPRGFGLVVRPGESAVADDIGEESSTMAIPLAEDEDPWAVAESIEIADVSDDDSEIVVGEDQDEIATSGIEQPFVSEPATTLESVSVETSEQGVLLHLQADGMLTSAETFVLENPDRLVVDLPGLKSSVPQDKIAIDSAWVQAVRIGVHPDKLRIVLDGGPSVAGFQGRRMIPAATGMLMTVGTGTDLDQALAAQIRAGNAPMAMASAPIVEEPLAAVMEQLAEEEELAEASTEALESPASLDSEVDTSDWDAMASGEPVAAPSVMPEIEAVEAPAAVFGLQYDRSESRDRIVVLADRSVEYEILTPDSETVVVRIENALMADSLGERITPEPGGPLSLISTFQQPDVAGDEVRVVLRRAAGLEPRVMRRGSLLFLDFENTGLAAAPPPAFIPGEPETYTSGADSIHETEVAEALEAVEVAEAVEVVDAAIDETSLEPTAIEDEPYTALPDFDEPAALSDLGPLDEMIEPMAADSGDDSPASLEGPAAVDILEEGGLIEGKEYVGRRISLDFKDVQIADVLRLIAEVSDLNIIAGDEVNGNITIRLVDVPWDQALDVILLTKGLGFVRVGNVLRIAPFEILKVEDELRLQERRNKEKLEDLEVKLQPVNYASVKDVALLVRRLLSPRGTVNTDKRTNTLIIKDIGSVIDEATALIQAIDTQTPQVMIEAKIVEANLEFGRELGSTWGVGTQPWVDGFNPGTPRNDLGNENFRFQGQNNVVIGNPITSVATGTVNFGAFLLDDKMKIDVQIQAMERAGNGKVISSPRIVTLDNREARIEQGVSIPFQTFEGGDAKLEFIDAVLSLKVTPHITTDKSIIMKLQVTRNAPDASFPTSTGSPAIAKNQAKTETLVKDGQTLVIGGIYTIDKSTRETRVPYLHRIPVIGAAFKSRQITDSRKELLIFVTPRIVVNPALAAD